MAARADDRRHHVRRVHCHAQEQDDGNFRHPARPIAASRPRTTCPTRSMSIPCGRPSRRSSSSTCCKTTRRTSWPSGWRTTARTTTTSTVERSAAMKGIMGWVRLHPYNIAQKVADRRRTLPRDMWPRCWMAGQGDGGCGEPRGSRPLATGDRQIHQGTRLPDPHAGGLFRRSERQGIRAGRVHGEQQGSESRTCEAATSAKPSRETSIRFCSWPINFRPASISPCCAACT